MTAARMLKDAGKFKEAAADTAEMYQMAQDVDAAVTARRDERAGLLNALNPLVANPDGALAADITDLDVKRRHRDSKGRYPRIARRGR